MYRSLDQEALANTLGCERHELNGPMIIGIREGLVSTGTDPWNGDPERFLGSHTITPAGEERYEHILTRYAQQVAGQPALSIGERFLLACGHQQPIGVERQLSEMADDLEFARGSDAVERDRALRLARAALGDWAHAALLRGSAHAEAAGLRSLDLTDLEALGYAGPFTREHYAPVLSGTLREVVDAAAEAAERAWELRPLTEPSGGISQSRSFDLSAAAAVSESAAEALRAAAHSGLVDLLEEARRVTSDMRQQPERRHP